MRGLLFGEAQGRVVLSTPMPDTVLSIAAKHGVSAVRIGVVRDESAPLEIAMGDRRLSVPLVELEAAYHEAIPSIMAQSALAPPA